jgi:Cu/Ag efflux pump CusA
VLASLLVAFTVTPALAALLLRVERERREPSWLEATRRTHVRALAACGRRPRSVMLASLVALLIALAMVPLLAGEFMPTFREGHFVAQVSARVPGTSFGEMTSLGRRISAELLRLPFIATVEQQVGRAEQGEDTWGSERSEFHIELKPAPGGRSGRGTSGNTRGFFALSRCAVRRAHVPRRSRQRIAVR